MYVQYLYNIFARILNILINRLNERDFEKMRNIKKDYENTILLKLKDKFPDLFDKETLNVAELSEFRLANSTLIQDLEYKSSHCEDMWEMVFLVRCLDGFLEDSFYDCIPTDEDWYVFHGLNNNVDECRLYLLPRTMCRWEHKNRDAYTSYSIYYYLRNFYYIRVKDMEGYAARHILMPKSFFNMALKRGEFRIAVSPGIDKKVVEVTEIYERDNSCYISVKPMTDFVEKELQEIMPITLKKAAEKEADILLFPEMLGSDKIISCLSEELYGRNALPDNGFPKLTVCPTVWKNHRNSCAVLDEMGEAIFEQCKHHGVDMKRPRAKEDIETDRCIYILHCYGIGRIAVAICKDFLITKYLRILAEVLKVNLLLVPSFTSGDYQFESLSFKYPELDWCVIWVNACSSRWLNERGTQSAHVFMAYMAGRQGIITEKISMDDLCGGEERCCQGCTHVYRIKFDEEVRI